MTTRYFMPDGSELVNVHSPTQCHGRVCIVHSPTNHHMIDWKLHWRMDRGIFERICSHGIGHPDPDQLPYWEEIGRPEEGVHGCCGCCFADKGGFVVKG